MAGFLLPSVETILKRYSQRREQPPWASLSLVPISAGSAQATSALRGPAGDVGREVVAIDGDSLAIEVVF